MFNFWEEGWRKKKKKKIERKENSLGGVFQYFSCAKPASVRSTRMHWHVTWAPDIIGFVIKSVPFRSFFLFLVKKSSFISVASLYCGPSLYCFHLIYWYSTTLQSPNYPFPFNQLHSILKNKIKWNIIRVLNWLDFILSTDIINGLAELDNIINDPDIIVEHMLF